MIESFSHTVKKISYLVIPSLVLVLLALSVVPAQTNNNTGKNNPYSPSPSRKVKENQPVVSPTPNRPAPGEVAFIMLGKNTPPVQEPRPTIAPQTFKIARTADLKEQPPSEIYRVGVGDVLFVNLKNSPRGSGYYSVKSDGCIDFPLAGDNIVVAGQTPESIEVMLATGITLFPDPRVEVKVREYSSHKVTVSGLVENAGEKSLQREAIPMFVIRADAIVSPKATKAIIKRAPLIKLETYDLRESNTDNVLVYPGNSIEFTGDSGSDTANLGVYFIAGEILSVGQKTLTPVITLYQAVIASGGAKGDPKKAVIRRKNDSGVLTNMEYNLRSIKVGKAVDPRLLAGDVIEIRN